MARHHKGRKNREFSYLNDRYVNKNYLKYYKHAVRDIKDRSGLTMNQINVMLFMYDYEFFTLDHIAEALYHHKEKFANSVLYPLQKKGWIMKVFDKNKISEMHFHEAQMHERTTYKNRYALSQKARLMVQRFYRKLEGDEDIIFS